MPCTIGRPRTSISVRRGVRLPKKQLRLDRVARMHAIQLHASKVLRGADVGCNTCKAVTQQSSSQPRVSERRADPVAFRFQVSLRGDVHRPCRGALLASHVVSTI